MREYMGRIIHSDAGADARYSVLGIGRADTLDGIKELVRSYLTAPSGKAFLHFGKGSEPRLTVSVPMRETDLPQGMTRTGYGARLPTTYLVQWEGRWRRVYAACYGNSPSLYIGPSGDWLATVNVERAA